MFKISLSRPRKQQLLQLSECGWLFMKIRKFSESRQSDVSLGLIGQSFCSALHKEQTEYLRLLSVLESQVCRFQCVLYANYSLYRRGRVVVTRGRYDFHWIFFSSRFRRTEVYPDSQLQTEWLYENLLSGFLIQKFDLNLLQRSLMLAKVCEKTRKSLENN